MKKARRAYTKYSQEFKKRVIMDMRDNGLSRHEAVRKHWGVGTRAETDSFRKTVRQWERKYMEEGAAGLMAGQRKRTTKTGRPPDKESDGDLAAEVRTLRERNLYLEAENAYLKNSTPWFERRRNGAAKGRDGVRTEAGISAENIVGGVVAAAEHVLLPPETKRS